jgi:hypothetical protein
MSNKPREVTICRDSHGDMQVLRWTGNFDIGKSVSFAEVAPGLDQPAAGEEENNWKNSYLQEVELKERIQSELSALRDELAKVSAEHNKFKSTLSRVANGQSFHPGSEASNVLKGLT